MLGPFTFEEGGRTYSCTSEKRTTTPEGTWWWFAVSNDSQRYAPFEAAAGDTQRTVRARIVAWYERRVWVRAQPVVPRERFGRPGKPAAVPVAPPKA
jgi:hypothetical protein